MCAPLSRRARGALQIRPEAAPIADTPTPAVSSLPRSKTTNGTTAATEPCVPTSITAMCETAGSSKCEAWDGSVLAPRLWPGALVGRQGRAAPTMTVRGGGAGVGVDVGLSAVAVGCSVATSSDSCAACVFRAVTRFDSRVARMIPAIKIGPSRNKAISGTALVLAVHAGLPAPRRQGRARGIGPAPQGADGCRPGAKPRRWSALLADDLHRNVRVASSARGRPASLI